MISQAFLKLPREKSYISSALLLLLVLFIPLTPNRSTNVQEALLRGRERERDLLFKNIRLRFILDVILTVHSR